MGREHVFSLPPPFPCRLPLEDHQKLITSSWHSLHSPINRPPTSLISRTRRQVRFSPPVRSTPSTPPFSLKSNISLNSKYMVLRKTHLSPCSSSGCTCCFLSTSAWNRVAACRRCCWGWRCGSTSSAGGGLWVLCSSWRRWRSRTGERGGGNGGEGGVWVLLAYTCVEAWGCGSCGAWGGDVKFFFSRSEFGTMLM